MAELTKQELYAAGAALCLAACDYGQPLDKAGRAALRQMRAKALQLLMVAGGMEPTEVKDLGLRLLAEAGEVRDGI